MIKTQDYFREFVTMLFIRKWIIILTTALFTLAAFLVVLFWPPVYEAAGSIMVKSNQPLKSQESVDDVPAKLVELAETDLFSEMQILESHSLISRTVEALNNSDGMFAGKIDSREAARVFAGRIKSALTIEVVPKTNVINVRLRWGSHDASEAILSTLFAQYLRFRSELYNPSEAQAFFQEQIHTFTDELRKREDELVQLAEKDQMAEPREQIKSNLLILENLQKDLTTLTNEHSEESRFIAHLEQSIASPDINFFTSVNNMDISDLGKKLQDLTLRRQELLKLYVADAPQVTSMDDQIAEAARGLKEEVRRYTDARRAKMEGLLESIANTQAKIKVLEARNVDLYRGIIANNRLNREINLLEESYVTFGKRLEEARISAQTETDTLFRVSVLTYPQANPAPVFPIKTKVIPLGVVIGLLIGCTIGFLLEFFDHTFKRPEDVANYSSLPNVYSIREY